MEKYKADYTNTWRALSTNITENPLCNNAEFKEWQQRWHERLQAEGTTLQMAMTQMQQVNPAVIPRNYYVEEALTAADQGDLTKVEQLLNVLSQPFSLAEENAHYASPPDQGPYRTFCGT